MATQLTIPIRQISRADAEVISAGGAPAQLNGTILTQDESVSPLSYLEFYTPESVSQYFGYGSPEALMAAAYFPGIVNGGQLPYSLKFVRYVKDDAPAGIFGASLPLTLQDLRELSGQLIIVTSKPYFSRTINLSQVSSFFDAASQLQQSFSLPDFSVSYDPQRKRFVVQTQAVGSSAICADASGTLAAPLGLSLDSGSTLMNQGSDTDTPTACMNRVKSFLGSLSVWTTSWTPDLPDRLEFSAWNSGQYSSLLYVAADMEPKDLQPGASGSLGDQVFSRKDNGTLPLYGEQQLAGAFLSYPASINFGAPNGRTAAAFRQFAGSIEPTCRDLTKSNTLLSHNYTYYGAYANSENNYTILYDGKVSGIFIWVDSYIDQMYLRRELERAGFETLLGYNSIPYNSDGYTYFYSGYKDVIEAAVSSGIIRSGVNLSASQRQQVDSQANRPGIGDICATRGWYLQIEDATNAGQMRQQRSSPFVRLWYCDGGSVQRIEIGATALI